MNRLLLVLLLPVLLLGCSTLQGPGGRDLAVTFSVMKIIENNSDPAGVAERARTMMDSAEALLNGDPALTVARLETEVRGKIDWTRYTVSEALLIDALITAARTDLEERIGPIEGLFDATRTARAKEILGQIRRAIQLAGY